MNKNMSFQYAILRYHHDPLTGEFVNVGVVVYSLEERYIKSIINKRYGRISKAFPGIDRANYIRMVQSIENQLTRLGTALSKRTLLDDYPHNIEAILAKILPPDDSSLRFSGFGGGIVSDLDIELNKLFYRFVEKYEDRKKVESRRDDEVWHDYVELFSNYQIVNNLEPKTLGTDNYSYQFSHTYKNDKWHPIEPVSLDLADKGYILEKANKWIGRASLLADSDEIGTLFLLLGAPSNPELNDSYEIAAKNLETKIPLEVRVFREEDAEVASLELNNLINKPH